VLGAAAVASGAAIGCFALVWPPAVAACLLTVYVAEVYAFKASNIEYKKDLRDCYKDYSECVKDGGKP